MKDNPVVLVFDDNPIGPMIFHSNSKNPSTVIIESDYRSWDLNDEGERINEVIVTPDWAKTKRQGIDEDTWVLVSTRGIDIMIGLAIQEYLENPTEENSSFELGGIFFNIARAGKTMTASA